MSSFPFKNSGISNVKAPRPSKRMPTNTKVAIKENDAANVCLKHFVQKGDGWIEITLPIITVSEANGGVKKSYKQNGKTYYKAEHWTDKHRRHKLQKGSVALMLRPQRDCLSLPCYIMLTRYAPDKLDRFDNLPMSLKWVLDAVCEIITGDYRPGRADAHEGILDVKYAQIQSSEYGVKVRIQNHFLPL